MTRRKPIYIDCTSREAAGEALRALVEEAGDAGHD